MRATRPTSAGQRNRLVNEYSKYLTSSRPEKSLTTGFRRGSGRNAFGRITTRHKGGGVKRKWREIDFLYMKKDIPAFIRSFEYDPNRSGFIALVTYKDGEKKYILLPEGMKIGQAILTSEKAPVEPGNRTLLRQIPVGTKVYNIELILGRGAVLVRSAGTSAEVIAQEGDRTTIKLPSGELRKVPSANWASVGSVSNSEHHFERLGKAGRMRRKGVRPRVRGTAMNPVDHPHGGGEGRTLTGRRRGPATPWGKPARGVKTRRKKNRANVFIIERRKNIRNPQ
ncbi:MAG: 50S ribosomal protein L2 [Patescibacteria group bacterium]